MAARVPFLSLAAVSAAVLLLLNPSLQSAQPEPGEGNFTSVEERRLQVRVIEAENEPTGKVKALHQKERELAELEGEIDRKLEELERRLAEFEQRRSVRRQDRPDTAGAHPEGIHRLSRIFERMEPPRAARALAELDRGLAADILAPMNPRSAARILDALDKDLAAEISLLLLNRSGL